MRGRGWQPPTLTPPHTSSPTTFPHKRTKTWRSESRRTTHAEAPPSTSRRKKESCAQHTHDRNERDGAHPSPRRCTLLPSAPTDWNYAPQRAVASHAHSEARRTPSSPLQVRSAGRGTASSHPRAIAKADTNNRRRWPSVPLAEKEMEACQQHSQQKDTQRDTEKHSGSEHGTKKKTQAFAKRNKKMIRQDFYLMRRLSARRPCVVYT
ncbi:hypothetical protein TcCL_Unassigned04648 [Trypanosoma cruzi]|nr:hypothetical protein TcCL_Unassigned04648 [Trypanosoma cruzi]